MDKREELKKEIEAKKQELAQLETELSDKERNAAIIPLSEISDSKKIETFDKLYKSAESMLQSAIDGEAREDDAHYSWEDIMNLLARDGGKFWVYYNKYNNSTN